MDPSQERLLLYRGQEFDLFGDLKSTIDSAIKANHPLRIFNSQTAARTAEDANKKREVNYL